MTPKKLFKKTSIMITVIVIVFLFLSNFALASQTKMNKQQAERIKNFLDIVKTTSNFGSILLDDGGFIKALNTIIKGGRTATDVTYGLLVLSAINEMELMDMVLSQEYKDIEKEYFEQIADERINLISYWKDVGFDLPKVLSGQITGPMSGLILNSFAMTNKIIQIAAEFEVLRKGKLYDGLWYYFDLRKNGNEQHEVAWREARMVMGFGAYSVGSLYKTDKRKNETIKLETQFSALWDKWGLYATPWGISEEYKKQAKEEMRGMLAVAAEAQRLAEMEKQKEPSWLISRIEQLKNLVQSVVARVAQLNPFSAGPIVRVDEMKNEKVHVRDVKDVQHPSTEKQEKRDEPQAESVETRFQPTPETESKTEDKTEEVENQDTETENEKNIKPEKQGEKKEEKGEKGEKEIKRAKEEPKLCEYQVGSLPKRYRVFINEVAWMGSVNSPNDEWIELRNIWGLSVKLNGWQLQDKDQQIKIIFKENDVIPAGGYFLLERTDDDSMPKAKADKIYTGGLNNSNEALYLFDNNCQIEDEVLANPDWPGGDNAAKKTMERLDPLYWYTSASIGGSAGKDNGEPPAVMIHAGTPAPQPPAPALTYPQVLINEIQTESPNSQQDDFVKLYNPNDAAVDLTDWYLQRKTANASEFSTYAPKTLFAGKTIQTHGYFLIANASANFATSADATTTHPLTKNNILALKNPNGEVVDEKNTGNNDSDNNSSSTVSSLVVINEIAWGGTKANPNDEWIELYNYGETAVDLTGWSIAKDDEEWIVLSTSSIPAQEYYLLERSDDQTISNIAADYFFTGALGNDGHKLSLKNTESDLIDELDFSSDWPAGQGAPNYISMERISPTSTDWANNNRITINGLDNKDNNINGTPKAENSVAKSLTEIIGDRIFTDDFTLMKLGSPYIWEGSLIIEEKAGLTVEPGVIIKFKHSAINQPHARLIVRGEMEAIGTEEEKIIFTSFRENIYWDGLYFENSDSIIENAIISYAGKWHQDSTNGFPPYTYGAIYIENGEVVMRNSLIENSDTFALWAKNSPSSLIDGVTIANNPGTSEKPAALYIESGGLNIQNSSFENNNIAILAENFYEALEIIGNNFSNNQTPIKISSLLANISENTMQNNSLNGILLDNFGFNEDIDQITWQKNEPSYVIEKSLTIWPEEVLEIDPGVIVKFKGGGAINANGSLIARGEADEKITFTSFSDDAYGGDTNNDGDDFAPAAGQWKFIKFSESSTDSDLENVIVRYGGFMGTRGGVEARDGAIKVENNTLSMGDSIIENNLVGIQMIDSDFDDQSQNIIVRNNAIGLYIEGACPYLDGITLEQNTEYDIFPTDCQD